MLIVVFLFFLVAAYGSVQGRYFLRRRRLSRMDLQEHLARIKPVNVDAVSVIALHFLNPSKRQLSMEPPAMWESIGEMDGLQALIDNADAILDLALFASRWNRVEGRIVGEMIRRDGVRLKRAAFRIQMATYFGLGGAFAPFQLQEVSAAYHLMRGRLLGLYQVTHVGVYPRLVEVL